MLDLTRETVREVLLLDEGLDFSGGNAVRLENFLNSFVNVLQANFGAGFNTAERIKAMVMSNSAYVSNINSVQNDFRAKIKRISSLTSERNQLAKSIVKIIKDSGENYGFDSESISQYVQGMKINEYFNENYLINAVKVLLKGDEAHASALK
jgi:uncharacterized protein (UPF0335 family)